MRKFETVEYKGFLWEIKGRVEDRPDQDIEMLKKKYLADLCLRKSGVLYLVEIIEDATIIDKENDGKT